ncbi:hypothetical protein QTN25_000170 [Entamoeba marina]
MLFLLFSLFSFVVSYECSQSQLIPLPSHQNHTTTLQFVVESEEKKLVSIDACPFSNVTLDISFYSSCEHLENDIPFLITEVSSSCNDERFPIEMHIQAETPIYFIVKVEGEIIYEVDTYLKESIITEESEVTENAETELIKWLSVASFLVILVVVAFTLTLIIVIKEKIHSKSKRDNEPI